MDVLASNESDEAIQTTLVDLLGFDDLALVSALLEQRATLLESQTRQQSVEGISKAKSLPVGPSVVIKRDAKSAVDKEQRKIEKELSKCKLCASCACEHPGMCLNGALVRTEDSNFDLAAMRRDREAALLSARAPMPSGKVRLLMASSSYC